MAGNCRIFSNLVHALFFTLDEFNDKYNVRLGIEKFIDIRYIVNFALQRLRIRAEDLITQ